MSSKNNHNGYSKQANRETRDCGQVVAYVNEQFWN